MTQRSKHLGARWLGIVVAVGVILVEVVLVAQLARVAPDHAFGARVALCVLVVLLPLALLIVVVGRARRRVAEAERRRRDADELARRQDALRRVATLVAGGATQAEVYPLAVTELSRVLDGEHVTLVGVEGDQCEVLASTDAERTVGVHLSLDDVGVPVVVGGQARCGLVVGSARSEPLPADTEDRVAEFADLVAAAIVAAETRDDLAASRARVIAAADRTRHGIERDLHDGIQQRVATLGLGLRTLEASLPAEQGTVRKQVTNLIDGMADLYTELQDLARGIHPASLSKSGLGPALTTLARRSSVPATLELAVPGRLPEPIEVTAYYVVAEALTNVAAHARASTVTVRATLDAAQLTLVVTDDGVGGAAGSSGSGLIGLRDRVEALSGELAVASRTGVGTTVTARIPVPA